MTIHGGRSHALTTGPHGAECRRCGMRATWPGWDEHCNAIEHSAMYEKGSPAHAAHIQRVIEWKKRNRERVRQLENARRQRQREAS